MNTKVVATGVLIPSGVNYSAPILAPTSDPQRFLWAASNGVTTFGELLIPDSSLQFRINDTIRQCVRRGSSCTPRRLEIPLTALARE